jgi:hypothetical protein
MLSLLGDDAMVWGSNLIRDHRWFLIGLLVLFAVMTISLYLVANVGFKVCVPADKIEIDKYQKTIAALDSVADISIKLCTALVGFGAALLIGLKSGVGLTPFVRFAILTASIFFVQSAIYAVFWRMGVAELWLNECLSLISQPRLTARYEAHLYFFLAGLFSLALVVIGAALGQWSNKGGQHATFNSMLLERLVTIWINRSRRPK